MPVHKLRAGVNRCFTAFRARNFPVPQATNSSSQLWMSKQRCPPTTQKQRQRLLEGPDKKILAYTQTIEVPFQHKLFVLSFPATPFFTGYAAFVGLDTVWRPFAASFDLKSGRSSAHGSRSCGLRIQGGTASGGVCQLKRSQELSAAGFRAC